MTVIIKSNKTFTGATSMGLLSEVTRTAQDIYNEYEDRVLADGGTIAEPTVTLQAISDAINRGYFYGTEIAVSPRWGMKLSGSNIVKVYNLTGGPDGIASGTVPLDTSTAAYNLMSGLVQFSNAVLLSGNGMCSLMTKRAGSSYSSESFTSGGTWTAYHGNITRVDAPSETIFSGNPQYGASAIPNAHGLLVEMAEKRITGVLDGIQIKSASASFTAIPSGATSTINLSMSNKVMEFWHLKDANLKTAMSAVYDVRQRM